MPLNVAMTLSLADSASPQIRAFIGLLERLDVVAKSVSQSMAGLGSIGSGGGSRGGISEANVQAWGRMVSMAEQMNARLDQMRGKMASAAAEMNQGMTQAMGRTAAAAEQQFQRVMQGRASTVNQARAEGARRDALSGAGFPGVYGASTQELAAMERQLRATRGPAEELNQSFVGIGDTIKGLAAIWGALKIEEGLKASVKAAIDFQSELATVKAVAGPQASKAAGEAAFRDSRNLPYASPMDALQIRNAIQGGLAEYGAKPMSAQMLDQLTPQMIEAVNALKMLGDKADPNQIARNLTAMFEARGQTADFEGMKRSLDIAVSAYAATFGKVTPTDLDVFSRRFGTGTQNLSDAGWRNMVAYIDQMKVMGGEAGGGVGGGASSLATAMKQLEAYSLGKPSTGQAREMFIESGIFDAVAGRKGMTAREPGLIAEDPVAFFTKYAPNIIAYTRRYMKEYYGDTDPNDPKAQSAAIQKFLAATGITVTAQQAVMLTATPDIQARTARQSQQMLETGGYKGINKAFEDTAKQNIENFTKSLERLQIVLGSSVLPTVTEVIKAFTSFLQTLADFDHEHPAAAHMTMLLGFFGALALAIVAAQKLLVPFGASLGSVLLGSGTAVESSGAQVASKLGTFFSLLGRIVARGFVVLGVALLAWDLLQLILPDAVIASIKQGFSDLFDWLAAKARAAMNLIANVGNSAREQASNYAGGDPVMGAIGTAGRNRPIDLASPLFLSKEDSDAETRRLSGFASAITLSDADRLQRAQSAAAADARLGPRGAGKKQKKPGYEYSADQVAGREDARLDEEERREELRELQAAYHAGTISIKDYYDAIVQGSRDAAAAVIVDKQIQIEAIEAKKHLTNRDKSDLERLKTDQKIAFRRYESEAAVADENHKKDLLALDRKAIDYERELMIVGGRRHDAELLHMREEMQFKQQALIDSGKLTQEQAAIDLNRATAAMKANQGLEDIRNKQAESHNKDLEIDNQVKSMALTEEEAARKKHENAVALALDLQTLIDKYIELARVAGNKELVIQLEGMKIQARGVLTELGPDAVAARNVMDGAFQGLFRNLLTGTKGIKAAFHDFFASLAQGFADLAAKQLSGGIMKMLFGGGGGGAADSLFSGNALGGIGKWFSGIFGSGGGSVAASGGDFVGLTAGPSIGDFFGVGLAGGIDYVPKNMIALIHEGERVVPKAQNKAGTRPFVQNNYFQQPVDTRSQSQIASATIRGMEVAKRIR